MAKQEPPVEEQWYPLKLGQTCSDDATSRFYSLRYEFKPASIDTSRRGSLRSSSDNKVTVEYFNNQVGKPKVAFEGNVGDYQEFDAVLFFDGQSFRLERMHRAVKSLRHIRMPGESSAAAANAAQKGTAAEPESPQDINGVQVERISSGQAAEKTVKKPAGPAVRSEKIEAEVAPVVTKPDPPAGKKKGNKKTPTGPKGPKGKKASPPTPPASPLERKREREPSPVNIEIDDEVEEASPSKKVNVEEEQVEVEEVVEEIEEEVSDYEEVDISEDEDADKTGVDQTAATLRAQAAAGLSEAKASSSSSSSGSGSSESGSGSSSSDSGSDEEDTASSADDGDDI